MNTIDCVKVQCELDVNSIYKKMDPWDVYVNIEGTFRVFVGNIAFLSEECFSIVEFVVQLKRWLDKGYLKREDFIFRSLEHDEDILWFKFQYNGFYIGSCFQQYHETKVIKEQYLIDEMKKCIYNVESELGKHGYLLEDYVKNSKLDSN